MTLKDLIIGALNENVPLTVRELTQKTQKGSNSIRRKLYSLIVQVSKQPNTYTIHSNYQLHVAKLVKENHVLRKQLDLVTKVGATSDYNFKGDTLRFGAIADAQLCSRYEKFRTIKCCL